MHYDTIKSKFSYLDFEIRSSHATTAIKGNIT